MILWGKRTAAVLSGVFLMALLFSVGTYWAGVAGGILSLAWAMAERFPSPFRRFFPPSVLVINTGLSAYGVLAGGPAAWALLAAGASLFSWNASLFLHRWPRAPLPVPYRYLRRIGGILAVGWGSGLSALALQGHISLPFLGAFLLMLTGGALYLRLITRASKNFS
jgi:hypothetical protein